MQRQPQRPCGGLVGVGGGGGRRQAAAGERLAGGRLARLGGQPYQQRGGDLAGLGELEVAGQLGGQPPERFAAPVVFQEEVQLGLVFAPAAVAVGVDQPAPVGGAALLGPPLLQRRRWILAGGVGEGTKEAVDA